MITNKCRHEELECINQHDTIRKYKCGSCGEVMMCACEQDVAQDFRPHQVQKARWLETKKVEVVTLGFVEGICEICRGTGPIPHPVAEIFGRTSKFDRYYWRELSIEAYRAIRLWALANGYSSGVEGAKAEPDEAKRIKREVRERLKALHASDPIYEYSEPSQAEVLKKHDVEIKKLDGTYARGHSARRSLLVGEAGLVGVEEYAAEFYRRQGYEVVFCESAPFHALFGVMMWTMIQHPSDVDNQMVGFARRDGDKEMLMMLRPPDFGAPGYAARRRVAIDEHFSRYIPKQTDELLWAFDYWESGSENLRQYLWAHESETVAVARLIVQRLPPQKVRSILRHLVTDYWRHYCGWPDLLLLRGEEYAFTEIKGSGDSLSQDQKRWIESNALYLELPFWLTKIHRTRTVDMKPDES